MPCLHPLICFRCGRRVFFSVPKAISAGIEPKDLESFKVRCGNCLDCRIQRSRVWSARCVAEASQYADNCFITLTYNDLNLPVLSTGEASLRIDDLQKFWKRLRKSGAKIRYFACGEYGSRTLRPHYHAIIFGWRPSDLRVDFIDSDVGLSRVYVSDFLSSVWSLGTVSIGEVSASSCAYVARYCVKKLSDNELGSRAREFVVMSRRPGIGGAYFERYRDEILEYDAIFDGRRWTTPPRLFENYLSPGEVESLKSRRLAKVVDYSPEELSRKGEFLKARWKKKRSF